MLRTTHCADSSLIDLSYIVIKTKNYTCILFLKAETVGIKFTSLTWGYRISNVSQQYCSVVANSCSGQSCQRIGYVLQHHQINRWLSSRPCRKATMAGKASSLALCPEDSTVCHVLISILKCKFRRKKLPL